MVEHSAVNRRVVGSNPTRGAKLFKEFTAHKFPLRVAIYADCGDFCGGCSFTTVGDAAFYAVLSLQILSRDRSGQAGRAPQDRPSHIERLAVRTSLSRVNNLFLQYFTYPSSPRVELQIQYPADGASSPIFIPLRNVLRHKGCVNTPGLSVFAYWISSTSFPPGGLRLPASRTRFAIS